MKDCYLKARAYVDWLELKESVEEEVERQNLDLTDLCYLFDGFNLEKEVGFFDCNYNSICATVRSEDGKCYVCNSIEIYDKVGAFAGTFYADELKKYIKEEE